ncbi:MAG: phosphoribosyl-AMP cyclohydrolase [Endomicrobiaceae bacterium]
MLEITKQLKFDKDGLIPAVVQDYKDGTVLMVAYMNAASFEKTLKTKKATYWSRSRQKFWIKGEESGNIQKVKEIYYDCDADCILIKVHQVGDSACHTGHRSCFYRKLSFTGNTRIVGKKVFDPKKVYGK